MRKKNYYINKCNCHENMYAKHKGKAQIEVLICSPSKLLIVELLARIPASAPRT